jgi:hypothetical protein
LKAGNGVKMRTHRPNRGAGQYFWRIWDCNR